MEFYGGNVLGFISDGARAITGRHGGVVTRMQSVASNAVFSHCNIHREAFAAKTLQSSFKDGWDSAIKVVNLIKARALNSRMLKIMCNNMGAEHDKLLLLTELRWLSIPTTSLLQFTHIYFWLETKKTQHFSVTFVSLFTYSELSRSLFYNNF